MKLESIPIELINCQKTFQKTQVLKPISLSIQAGETLVLLGPSGCGKTTTLRLIAGLESPDRGGRVLFGSDDVTGLPIEKRAVGMVFQSYALFPNMSVAQNIAYGLKVRKLAPDIIRQKVNEMLAMMELDALGSRRIDQLSGGQKQRVALARAIAPEPRVLLLDEPLTALDAQLRETLRSEINSLLRSLSITTVYVTHDQSEAMALADRIAVMDQGTIAQIGTPRDIYYKPATPFVAQFIGTMNRIYKEGQALAFRPEDVSICGIERAKLIGVVEDSTFLGSKTNTIIRLSTGERVTANISSHNAPQIGDRVGLDYVSSLSPC